MKDEMCHVNDDFDDDCTNRPKINPTIKQAIDFFTEHYSHLIEKETFDEKDYPDGFCKCLNPLLLGQNENIIRDVKGRKSWKDIEKKLEGTGELTSPDSHGSILSLLSFSTLLHSTDSTINDHIDLIVMELLHRIPSTPHF